MNSDSDSNSATRAKYSALRTKGYVFIRNRPCKIVELSTSRPGKHGHAKVHVVGIDMFTGKKMDDISPATHMARVPEVIKRDYDVAGLNSESVFIRNDDFESRDLPLPDGDLGLRIRKLVSEAEEEDEMDVAVTVHATCGQEVIVAARRQSNKRK